MRSTYLLLKRYWGLRSYSAIHPHHWFISTRQQQALSIHLALGLTRLARSLMAVTKTFQSLGLVVLILVSRIRKSLILLRFLSRSMRHEYSSLTISSVPRRRLHRYLTLPITQYASA